MLKYLMYKTPFQKTISKEKVLEKINNQNNKQDFKRVDVNILLNRVKINNKKKKIKTATFILFTSLGLCFAAYLIL